VGRVLRQFGLAARVAVAICLLVLLVGPILLFQRQQQRSLERRS
jgi:hypothetical protein